MVITCVLLGMSGGFRFWRDLQFQTIEQEGSTCPFPLSELPNVLGNWKVLEGSETQLDPEIARIAGSSDHVVRAYVDGKSGEKVIVLVLYGLASSVFGHAPEICYPAAGYQMVGAPEIHQFSLPGSSTPVRSRSEVFAKSLGAIPIYEEVYYTFLHNGEWLPDMADRWKMFRYHPGMFKIQLQRQISSPSIQGSPSESLLVELMKVISDRASKPKS
jgi:hypothetical protein